jgi:arabinogalactan oligomer/maltooligosaccharide transport system substrate-binding protein
MKKHFKILSIFVVLMMMLAPAITTSLASEPAQTPTTHSDQLPAVDLLLWSKDSEAYYDATGFIETFDAWAAENAPGSTLTYAIKDVEELRQELQSAALAGEGLPDFLWTVADHAGPFTEAGLIQPLDELLDLEPYLNTVVLNGQTWGVPVEAGNHLMLIYNKQFVETPPATVEELIDLSTTLIEENADIEGFTPFLFSHTESFWVLPWMQAINPDGVPFVGFAEDGVTPDLNNDSVIHTFELLSSFKEMGITADECAYECLDGFFKEGKAAMTINGPWSLGGDTGVVAALGEENVGLAPFPMFEDGQPAPLVAGTYFMIPTATEGDKLDVITAFIEWYTTDVDTVIEYTIPQNRLPGLLAAFEDPRVSENRLVGESAAALATGVPQPVNVEMRCIFDAITQEYQAVMNGSSTPEEAAANAQAFAESCIADFE